MHCKAHIDSKLDTPPVIVRCDSPPHVTTADVHAPPSHPSSLLTTVSPSPRAFSPIIERPNIHSSTPFLSQPIPSTQIDSSAVLPQECSPLTENLKIEIEAQPEDDSKEKSGQWTGGAMDGPEWKLDHRCKICKKDAYGVMGSEYCKICIDVWYCSRECQDADRKYQSLLCKANPRSSHHEEWKDVMVASLQKFQIPPR